MNHSDGHSLAVLDYPRLREWLAGMCQTPMGRERMLGLEPMADAAAVEAEFDRVDELLALAEEPQFGALADLRPLLERLRAEGVLEGIELLSVQRALVAAQQCRDFYARQRERLSRVWPIAAGLAVLPELARAIESAIDESGAVRDSASPELARVRVEMRRRRNALVARLERLAGENPDWFNGGVTVKGDRYVLPLLLGRRGSLPGVVHASSGSGQTLFVEPLEMVADGNELQELRDAEAEEVGRILRELSQKVGAAEPALTRTMTAAAELDALNAKRRFCRRLDCTRPSLTRDGSIAIVEGRHPLLVQRQVAVVPLGFRLDPDTDVVLISGPNAGGKTVVLKTLGLFALMAASGLHLPAGPGTALPLFGRVFADIGDEQSLDEDLSSFTAHLGRLRDLLVAADKDSLVLVDEIGSSTSPEEGAALAIAVLEELRRRRVKTVVTTHFGMLKVFVQSEPGMINAAMEYRDGPTYRFRMGMPGESSAFATAAAAGLPHEVLDRARKRMGREWLDFESKLNALDAELESARRTRRAAEQEAARLGAARRAAAEALAAARAELADARERQRLEEERFLRERRRDIENLVRRIRESGADHESVVAAKAAVEQRLAEVVADAPAEPAPTVPPDELAAGDTVESMTFRRQGLLVELAGTRATVAFGNIRLELAAADLRKVSAAPPPPDPVEVDDFSPQLNVLGMTRDEAESALARFIDSAVLNGCRDLVVLHGKGAGVLRRAVWEKLRHDGRVEDVRFAEAAEGGEGVSRVRLKAAV